MEIQTELDNLIRRELPDAAVEVTDLTGGGDHFGVTVASDVFIGKRLLDQHRMVMEILREQLQSRVHAVKITTMTKERYRRRSAEEDSV